MIRELQEIGISAISFIRKALMVGTTVLLPVMLIPQYAVFVAMALPLVAALVAYFDAKEKYSELSQDKDYTATEIKELFELRVLYAFIFIVAFPFWVYFKFIISMPSSELYAFYETSYFRNYYILDAIYDSEFGEMVKSNLPASRAFFKPYGYFSLLVMCSSFAGCLLFFFPFRIVSNAYKKCAIEDASYKFSVLMVIVVTLLSFIGLLVCLFRFHGLYNSTTLSVNYSLELELFVVCAYLASIGIPYTSALVLGKANASGSISTAD
ncbi:MAG: hypothetical protein AB2692_23520 [Candidatus Thiodiazotropha sp.]